MGKLTAESSGLETAAPRPRPAAHAPRRRGDLLVPLGATALAHLGAVSAYGLGPGGAESEWVLFYAAAALFGATQTALHPAGHPRPLWAASRAAAAATMALWVAWTFAPDHGACLPEPGVPALAYPAMVAAMAAIWTALGFLGEAAARRVSPALRVAAKIFAPGLAVGALAATLLAVVTRVPGPPYDDLFFTLFWTGLAVFLAAVAAAAPSHRLAAAPE